MNIEELNEKVKNNQKRNLKETIKQIEKSIISRASNGFNNIEIYTDTYSYTFLYTIDKWMLEPVKEHFEDNGYKVKVKEIKDPIKWIEKLLRIYEPEYLMVISWKDIN